MNPISQILWEAAADVERRGVTRTPRDGETCAVHAISITRPLGKRRAETDPAKNLLRLAEGLSRDDSVANWNDAQPSRAVVAAAMRDAAFLASWAGPHLLGGSK